MTIQTIQLNKLALSDLNVRKVKPKEIEALAALLWLGRLPRRAPSLTRPIHVLAPLGSGACGSNHTVGT